MVMSVNARLTQHFLNTSSSFYAQTELSAVGPLRGVDDANIQLASIIPWLCTAPSPRNAPHTSRRSG